MLDRPFVHYVAYGGDSRDLTRSLIVTVAAETRTTATLKFISPLRPSAYDSGGVVLQRDATETPAERRQRVRDAFWRETPAGPVQDVQRLPPAPPGVQVSSSGFKEAPPYLARTGFAVRSRVESTQDYFTSVLSEPNERSEPTLQLYTFLRHLSRMEAF